MTLRVLSYNIREGGNDRLVSIAGLIRQQRPDAVALLEANSRAGVMNLARNLGMEPVLGEANNECHVAWLSRLPIQRSENHRLAVLAKTLLEIEVAWLDGPLRLFATHLASRHDPQSPAEEMTSILNMLPRATGWPHLLVGDLNALHPDDSVGSPPRDEEKRGDAVEGASRHTVQLILEAGYADCYRALHPHEPGYTYPSIAPWLRLDYIFASSRMAANLRACDIVMGKEAERASDHFAIWAEFHRTARPR